MFAQNCGSAVCVLTSQNDNSRDSYNGKETVLTPASVQGMSTSAKFQLNVDVGDLPLNASSNPVSAQPLYVSQVPNVGSPPATHNLLIVATLNGTAFAFDADNNICNSVSNTSTCWSRQGTGGAAGTNALWMDDCLVTSGPPTIPGANLPFAGVVSTPVIDVGLTTQSIFLTSLCVTSSNSPQWWVHRLNLETGADVTANHKGVQITSPQSAPTGSDGADSLAGTTIQFVPNFQNQRPALLEVPNPSGAGSSIIYIAFGTLSHEDSPAATYHGWVFGYDTSLNQQFAFVTTAAGCGTGGGISQCSGAGTGTPPCDCKVESGFGAAPNWGGHGGGIWMSTRGFASSNLADGNAHVFFGVSNGGFQDYQAGSPNNFGTSILDMRLTASGPDATPFQSFTPNTSVLEPAFQNGCGPAGTPVNCSLTYQNLNAADYDMATSGILLFNDAGGAPRLVTMDKGGYGYLLGQGNLCGPRINNCSLLSASPVQGFASGDNGNVFPFAPIYDPAEGGTVLCTNTIQPDLCHRVTSLALFPASTGQQYLFLWPYQEKLTALTVSDGSTQLQQTTSLTGTGTTVTLSGGTCAGYPCFNNLLVAGDKITPVGFPAQTVLRVQGPASALITPGFSGTAPSWTYSGYLVNPALDVNPPPTGVGYAGGALAVSANAGQYGMVWSILAAQGTLSPGDTTTRAQSILLAYGATPTVAGSLQGLYQSSTYFCATPFALPTVANGRVYVPTYAISSSSPCPSTASSPSASGILVFGP